MRLKKAWLSIPVEDFMRRGGIDRAGTAYLQFSAFRTDRILEVTREEDGNFRKAAEEVFAALAATAGEIIRKNDYEVLGIPKALGPVIERSYKEGETIIITRFDATYPDLGGLQIIEANTFYVGMIAEMDVVHGFLRVLMRPDLGQPPIIRNYLTEVIPRIINHAKGRPVFYPNTPTGEDPKGNDLDKIFLESVTTSNGESLKLETAFDHNLQAVLALRHDLGGKHGLSSQEIASIMAYEPSLLHYFDDTHYMTPPAWAALLDNKGVFAYMHRLYGGSIKHAPATSFRESDYGRDGPLACWRYYVRKPVNKSNCIGVELHDAERLKQDGRSDRGEEEKAIFQAFRPTRPIQSTEQEDRDINILVRPFLVGGRPDGKVNVATIGYCGGRAVIGVGKNLVHYVTG
jgi:hypothetical protein